MALPKKVLQRFSAENQAHMIRKECARLLATMLLVGLTWSVGVAQVLETADGDVEFIGLHHWTPEQVRDTLAALRPEIPLTSGACAGVLQLQAGFPQAAVHVDSNPEPDGLHTVITLVEPQESERVRYSSVPADSLGPVDRWWEAYELLEDSGGEWSLAVQFRGRDIPPELWPRYEGRIDSTRYAAARNFLESHTTEEDLRLALDVLARDRTPFNRVIAVTILGGFADREEALHGLVRAARGYGPLDWGRASAVRTLGVIWRHVPVSVDWTPVEDDLAALIDGTNLFAFMPVLELLARTGLPAELTRDLLGGGAPLVIDHLAAKSLSHRQAARLFLERVSGEDYGDDVQAWKAWLANL
jgi:hypothetical protein